MNGTTRVRYCEAQRIIDSFKGVNRIDPSAPGNSGPFWLCAKRVIPIIAKAFDILPVEIYGVLTFMPSFILNLAANIH